MPSSIHKGSSPSVRSTTDRGRDSEGLPFGEELESYVESLPEIAFLKDLNSRYVTANKGFRECFGVERYQIRGKSDAEILPAHLSDRFEASYWNAQESSITQWHEEEFVHSCTGQQVNLLFKEYPKTNEQGEPMGIIGLGLDITPIKERSHFCEQQEAPCVDESLVQSARLHKTFFQMSKDPLLIIKEGQFVEANDAALRILGYKSRDEIRRIHPHEISPEFQPDGRLSSEKADEMLRRASGKGFHRFEWLHQRRNGEVFPTQVSLTKIHLNQEESIFCAWRDISDVKRAEKKLIQAKEFAERASRSKSKFLSSITHELRTPMNLMMGFNKILQEELTGKLTPDQEEYLKVSQESGHELMRLIDQVIAYGEMEHEQTVTECEQTPLQGVIMGAIESVRSLAAFRKIDLNVGCPENENLTAWTDHRELTFSISRLLGNAIKYNHEGGYVAISYRQLGSEYIRIIVEDAGFGIAEEFQSEIFDPFARGGRESGPIAGIGLGLSKVDRSMKKIGGHAGFFTELDKGSVFWIDVPTGSNATEDIYHRYQSEPETLSQKALSIAETRRTVLYLSLLNQNSESKALGECLSKIDNLSLRRVHDVQTCLAIAQRESVDMVFVEIDLESIDRFEILREFQKLEKKKTIPIVAISDLAAPSDIKGALDAGFSEYLNKPFTCAKLRTTLSQVFETPPKCLCNRWSPTKEDFRLIPTASGREPRKAHRKRVLLAEDNKMSQLMMSKALERLGYDVQVTDNGREAVTRHASDRFDAILMDIDMPVMSGVEATEMIRALPEKSRAVPIIAVTTRTRSDQVDSYFAVGMNMVLSKPVKGQELEFTLSTALGERALFLRSRPPPGDP